MDMKIKKKLSSSRTSNKRHPVAVVEQNCLIHQPGTRKRKRAGKMRIAATQQESYPADIGGLIKKFGDELICSIW
jgi:hypothetical protein